MWKKIIKFFEAPVFSNDEEKTRRARALHALHINMGGATALLGTLGILFVFPEKRYTSLILIITLLLLTAGMIMNRRGYVKANGILILVALWIITIFMTSISGGIRSLDIIFFVSGTVVAGIIFGARATLFYAGLSLLTGLGLILAGNTGVIFSQLFIFPPISAWVILFINLVFTVAPLQVALQSLSESVSRAQSNKERYRLIASVMSDYVFSIRYAPDGRITDQWISGAFEAITGYTSEELIAQGGWSSIVHPEDRERDAGDMAQLRANQKVITEIRLVRKDGGVRWVRSYGHPLWNEQSNQLAGIYGAVQDITASKQTENDLIHREAILEIVADAANLFLKVPNWTVDIWHAEVNNLLERLGTTIKASHAYVFENHLAEDNSVLMSMKYEWVAPGFKSDLHNPKYTDMPMDVDYMENWNKSVSQGIPYIGDTRHATREDIDGLGTRGIYALLDVPIYVDGKWWGTIGFDDMARAREWSNAEVGALVVAANLLSATIQRQRMDFLLQNELQQRKNLIDELEAKNAELERFTYTVSHDLRSPLVTIKGFLGFMEKDASAGNMENFRKDMQRVGSATDRMDNLLKGVLEISRTGRLVNKPQEVAFADLVDEALEIVHGRIQQRGITVRTQPDLPIVYGDRQRLTEVLQNLLDNAAKYIGDQKNPLIEIGINGSDNSNNPIFFVRDNGMGIDPQYYESIFGIFDKLDAASEGTGIGLALVKRIIEFHGGKIWVESEAGKGTTFFFTIAGNKEMGQ